MIVWVMTHGYMRQSGCHLNTGAIHMQLLFVTIRGIVFHTAPQRLRLTIPAIVFWVALEVLLTLVE